MNDFVLPDLCDAHEDRVRVVRPGFRSYGGRAAFGGPIRTVKTHEDNSLVAEYVREPGAGAVLVVDGGGSLRCALLGDNLALAAAESGWAGIVIYGCVRDVDELARIDLGVQALAANPLRSVKRGGGLRDLTLQFHDVSFVPGEYLYADGNGIVVAAEPLI